MTPMDYGTTSDCEFIGGPVDGLAMRIENSKVHCRFVSNSKVVETVKSCGVSEVKVPFYVRTNDRRFRFVGYR